MEEKDFEKLITADRYQVFLMICPAMIPVNFAAHSWFVCVKNGKTNRYEVRHYRNKEDKTFLHINALPPFAGIEKFLFTPKKIFWKAKLLKHISGNENSLSEKIIDFIEKSPDNYPFLNKYSLLGPNSNTYTQWVLNNFSELSVKLPLNCAGKNYKIPNCPDT